MNGIDYKKKYMDLRAQMVSSMDLAFRMGYEQGSKEAQMQAAQQQAMAQQQMAAQQQPGQPGAGQQPGQAEELDQYIAELEGLVNKNEISQDDLKKSLDKIKTFQTFSKMKPIKIGNIASANMGAQTKKELSMQEKVIEGIMLKWEKEAPNAASDILSAVSTEALTKKE
jgi:hypothetical protein